MELETVKEKNTAIVTISFKDEDGLAVIPTKAYYSLYCETTSTEIIAETEISSPGSEQSITITPAQNEIIDDKNDFETRIVTARWTYSGNKQGASEYRYKVENLKRIT